MSDKKIFFIIGTGRSGTHLLGRTIQSHPKVKGFIEHPSYFIISAVLAATQDILPFIQQPLRNLLVKRYQNLLLNDSHSYFMDKSHTNLWTAEFLSKKIPEAFLIGIYRDLLPTVSSMLKHGDVMRWYRILPQWMPNRFLGIDKYNKSRFRKLSLEEKCVLRWSSHKKELERLASVLSEEKFLLIKYEDFMSSPEKHLANIAEKSGIDNQFNHENLNDESLTKWKSHLNEAQIDSVNMLFDAIK